jgi:DNA-directed RNA polymerase alpha subunit
MGILDSQIDILQKSRAYPYGLTEYRIQLLKEAGIKTVGELVELDDSRLYAIYDIGEDWVRRIKYVVGQAIWM